MSLPRPPASTVKVRPSSGDEGVGGGGASLRNVSMGSPTVPTGVSTAARL